MNNSFFNFLNAGRVNLLLLLLTVQMSVYAEGSKELTSNGGNRAYLLSTLSINPSYPYPTLGTMKVYVKMGEAIYLGSSAQGIGAGTIRLRAPDGSTYNSGSSKTTGYLGTRSQEIAGPLPNVEGYIPFIIPISVGQEGVWEIDFISPTNGVEVNGNPPPYAANTNWVQPNSQYIAAFDISVRNAGNTAFLSGRVFTNVLIGILGTFNVGFNAILNVLTKDGYNYTLDNNGQAGNGFTFFANNKGFRNEDGRPSYKSLNSTTVGVNVYDPSLEDTPSDITHKIFFNTPAADLPASAPTPSGTTWLVNIPVTPSISNVAFTGANGTPGIAGTVMAGGRINFAASANGTYKIAIDVNQNGKFDDGSDRQFTGTVTAGNNQVSWDGRDGQGELLPASAGNYSINVTATLFAAEVHFPFFDVERSTNGIKLTRINGTGSPDNTIYWDDSPITVVGVPSNPVVNLSGINSLTNGHKWGGAAANSNDDNDFGNNKSIDTWAYVINSGLGSTIDIRVQTPDPSGLIKVPNIITPNGDGKNDMFEIKGISSFPGSRLFIFNRWGNEVYKSENYSNNWDANGLAEGTYYYLLELKTGAARPTAYKGWLYINRK